MSYFYIIKTKILMSLAYRFDVIANILVQSVVLMASVFFWKAVYAGSDAVADTSLKQMIDYSIIALLLSAIHSTSVEGEINSRIRNGSVALDFLKPVNILGMYFASDIGIIISNLCIKTVPLLILAGFLFGLPIPPSFTEFLFFFLSAFLGFFILWLISAIFGLFSFWIIELGPVGIVKDNVINLLSGRMIPLWFMPVWFGDSLKYWPFIHIFQTPISIYIGKLNRQDALFSILIQTVWLGILFVCFYALQKKAYKNVIIQGG